MVCPGCKATYLQSLSREEHDVLGKEWDIKYTCLYCFKSYWVKETDNEREARVNPYFINPDADKISY